MKAKIKENGTNNYDGWWLKEYESHIGYCKHEKRAVDFEESELPKVKEVCKKYNLEIMEVIK